MLKPPFTLYIIDTNANKDECYDIDDTITAEFTITAIIAETAKAYLFRFHITDTQKQEIWIPKSIITYLDFKETEPAIPEWFAAKVKICNRH